MIIDLILERKDGTKYSPKKFYNDVTGYGEIGWDISEALDSGEESDVKIMLSNYIIDNDYNPDIIDYINSVQWL